MAITTGLHHLGLTVAKLEPSAAFFTDMLGWQELRRDNDYPAIYVSDGHTLITLWASRQKPIHDFNKNSNIGLHHFALLVESEQKLIEIYNKLKHHNIEIEFAPELLRNGPAKHMICYEPSGIRVEFIWMGQQ